MALLDRAVCTKGWSYLTIYIPTGVEFEGGNAVFWGAMDDTFIDHIFVFLE